MSYLTQPIEELERLTIAALETETGLTFNENTERVTQFYARCLGQSTAWLTKSEARLLAELNAEMGGDSVSHLRYSYARLLDTLNGTLGGGGGGYQANAVTLDGNAWLETTGNLTSTDNGDLSYSVWVKFAALPANSDTFIVSDPNGNYTSENAILPPGNSSKWSCIFDAVDFSKILQFASASAPATGQWINIKCAVRTNFSAGNKIKQLYFGDTDVISGISDLSAAFIPVFNGVPFFVFGNGARGMTCDVSEAWIAPGQFVDFSVEANRRKFIDASGKPVDLGADGSTPTGTAPRMFFSGNASGFATNKGTGGAFTLTGSLTNAATSPSD